MRGIMLNWLPSDITFINGISFTRLLVRFIINLIFIGILIRGIYYPINKKREYLFVFFIFNVLIFFVSSLLSSVKMEAGFAFGLFAVFSIIRYRTQQIPIKEMTFLFISIILATINSTVTAKLGFLEVVFGNCIILIVSFIMEKSWIKTYKESIVVEYEKIELIVPEQREKLLNDLRKRTGLDISEVTIEKIDFLKDIAEIRIYYKV